MRDSYRGKKRSARGIEVFDGFTKHLPVAA